MNPQTPPADIRAKVIMRRAKLEFYPANDIVKAKVVKIPDTIVILGSGPNGRPVWPKIPADAYVIAVNESVNACIDHPSECAFTPAMWVVNDRHVPENAYFDRADDTFKGVRVFGDIVLQILLGRKPDSKGQLEAAKAGRLFSFRRAPFHKWDTGPWVHDPDIFVPGGTVCSAALWVGYIKGPPKTVYLCGIDMSKDLHYSSAKEPEIPDHRHGDVWNSRTHLDWVLKHYASLGVKHYTLSKTKLENVEYADAVVLTTRDCLVSRKLRKLPKPHVKGEKKPPYLPSDDILGEPTDKWMQMGNWPLGQGHTAIVSALKDGNQRKAFRAKWLAGYSWMLTNEIRGLKLMAGIHAPNYITHDVTSITMSDVGVHLNAENMPDDWDAQIGSIIGALQKVNLRHNDIIPRNIMVKDGEIKLIDFSMAIIIGDPFPEPWPNKRLLKIVQRDGDEVMLRRAINYLLGTQKEWKEVKSAIANLGTKLCAGSTTRAGWMYHDVPFEIEQTAHRKHTGKRALAIKLVYDLNGKTGFDLGSSVGGMSFWLNKFGATMVGVERDPQAFRVAMAFKNYYAMNDVRFICDKANNVLKQTQRYDFVCYLSTFMWVLKEEGLKVAKESLARIGEITDTLFFETSHGDAMAGGAVIKAGLDDKTKMDNLVMECTGLSEMNEIFTDKGWNDRRLVMYTR